MTQPGIYLGEVLFSPGEIADSVFFVVHDDLGPRVEARGSTTVDFEIYELEGYIESQLYTSDQVRYWKAILALYKPALARYIKGEL